MSFGSRSLDPATPEELSRWVRMKQMGCVCCWMVGRIPMEMPEIHHLKSGNVRIGHRFTIALCAWHHRAIRDEGKTAKQMAEDRGPSLAQGSRAFHTHYVSDQNLLDWQDHKIDWPLVLIPTRRIRKNGQLSVSGTNTVTEGKANKPTEKRASKGNTSRPLKVIPRSKFV